MTKVELLKQWRAEKSGLKSKIVEALGPFKTEHTDVRVSNFLAGVEEELTRAALDEHLVEEAPKEPADAPSA